MSRTRGGSALVAAASLLVLLGAACDRRSKPANPQPDVLLLTVDTLRPDYMSMNGYDKPTTPNLDAVLGEGWFFEQAVTPIARTTPALASLFTGAYPHATGVRTLTSELRPDMASLAEALSKAGYQTFAEISNHVLGPETRGLDRGFDRYEFNDGLVDAETLTHLALASAERAESDRPLFLWVHYIDPHIPYQATEEQLEIFDPGYSGPYRSLFQLQDRAGTRRALEERGQRIHKSTMPEAEQDHVRRLYASSIRTFDDAVGRLVDGMRDRSRGNLLIAFTADHGESLGEHDFFWDHGDYVYNASLRVPLAFVLPGSHALSGSGRCPGWVSLVDFTPTLLELLGAPPGERLSKQFEGRSLTPCMRGEALPPRAQFAESGHAYHPTLVPKRVRNDVAGRLRSVIFKDWKLVWNPFQASELEWELYDLSIDPHEEHDVYTPESPQLPFLKAALLHWTGRQAAAEALPELNARDIEALRAMGYIE
jgi:arylsulfatase A-like enzyme